MKSVEEIKGKLQQAQTRKWKAKKECEDINYRIWCKAEKLLKWILDDDADLRLKKSHA